MIEDFDLNTQVEFRITDSSPPMLEFEIPSPAGPFIIAWDPSAAEEVRDRINDYLQIVEEFAAAEQLLDTIHSTA